MKKSTAIYVGACILSGISCLFSYIAGMEDGIESGFKVGAGLNDIPKTKVQIDPKYSSKNKD
jgi:hypothetical protein